MHGLLGNGLAHGSSRNFQDLFACLQQREVVLDVEIAWVELHLELVRVPTHDLLQLEMCKTSILALVVWGEERLCQVRVPADALDLVRIARVHGDDRIDRCLI